MGTRTYPVPLLDQSYAEFRHVDVDAGRSRDRAGTARVWIGIGCAAVVAVLAWMEYAHVLRLGTVYEDAQWMDALQSQSWSVRTRPLALSVWRLTAAWPLWGVHLLSVLIHAANAALVGVVARRIGVSARAACAAAALLLLHPVTSETVAYLSARADLIAATGVLLAVLAWTSRWPWLAVLPLGLALLCKESAVVGVVLLPLVRRQWALATAMACALLGMAAWYSATELKLPPTYDWLTWQLIASGRLLSLFAWPSALSVAYDYEHMAPLAMAGCIGLVGLVAITALLLSDLLPLVAVGLAWALAVFLPRYVLITPTSLLNEHQAYLAIAGLAIATSALFDLPRLAWRR